eukprot:GGOE01043173.1.p1 GENE.GGOE01043173.1~~GGOE01043173.1.p1  ORF type:complete len:542 (-),score=82.26 GGOE01043173.1:165-1763(-)
MWADSIILVLSSAFKLLLLPAYRSTDFEVHRNWLAVTSSVRVVDWYREDTSEWTLDYPPFFAWFELLLGKVAQFVDPQMLMINNLEYSSFATVAFQRSSVIFFDLFLFYSLRRFYSFHFPKQGIRFWLLLVLSFLQPGLLIVDHVHFQYNGFLFGILILCLCLFQEGHTLLGGITFAILLNTKHIFLYLLPAAFLWLLRFHCFHHRTLAFKPVAFMQLGLSVLSIFFLSLAPWLLTGRIHDVVGRLFPFGRGLCHAYWAANAWAIYNVVDKAICFSLQRTLRPDMMCGQLSSRGLVGTSGTVVAVSHPTLFDISPAISLTLVAASLSGLMVHIWTSRTMDTRQLVMTFSLSAYGFFMFGWHVHEKAMLMYVLPLSLLNMHADLAPLNWHLTILSTYALFPLLFRPQECLLKWLILATYSTAAYFARPVLTGGKTERGGWWQRMDLTFQWAVTAGIPLQAAALAIAQPWMESQRLAFLPLMSVSVFTAVAMVYYWVRLHAMLGSLKYCLCFLGSLGVLLAGQILAHALSSPAL